MDGYEQAEERIAAARVSGATWLRLDGLGLETLPESLRSLTGLTDLWLASNRLTGLPDWLRELTALNHLGLIYNELTALPEWLGDLTSLTALGAHRNRLTALPASLAGLTGLTRLHLSSNELTALPEWIGDLTALTTLDLDGNRLTALPESLGNLAALTRLSIAGNRLTALPESLGRLTGLSRLDLAGNRFTSLPEWFLRPAPTVATPLQTATGTVHGPEELDALLDRAPSDGITLFTEDGQSVLFVHLAGDRSDVAWEGDSDIMLSWGPVPPGAPGGLTAGDAGDVVDDPWFTPPGAEPFEMDLTEEQARAAAHEFLRTGRRPTNVQWVDKP